VIPNAGDVQVHFGKNNGVALSKLSERSLSWYATEQPPRLDSSGKPYPARPQETTLRNAARTLWHQNRGTLGQADARKPNLRPKSSRHPRIPQTKKCPSNAAAPVGGFADSDEPGHWPGFFARCFLRCSLELTWDLPSVASVYDV